jgi:hypothetical protein
VTTGTSASARGAGDEAGRPGRETDEKDWAERNAEDISVVVKCRQKEMAAA